MDIYDDQDTFLASLNGRVSASGYCELAGDPDPTPGFSLSLLDGNGEQLPSTSYVVEMAMWAAAVPSGNPQATATQTNFVETTWWQGVATFFNVAYQQIYNPSSQNGMILRMMIGNVVSAAITRYPNFDPNPAVIRGIPDVPFCLLGPAEWATLYTDLTNSSSARNLYYFGHGGPDRIGYTTTNQQINLTDLKNILKNAPDPLKGTNAHPYRFVFLDGCKTANGDMPTAFGVPKGNVPVTEFTQKRGIRPRAFVGWNKNCTIAWGAFDQQHVTFLESFFDKWANARDPFGSPIGIRAAIQQANPTAWTQKPNLTVHGDEGLWFMDDQ